MSRRIVAKFAAVAIGVSLGAAPVRAAKIDEAIGLALQDNKSAAGSQATIDGLSDDTDALAAKFRATLQETEALRVYNHQLEELVGSQANEMASLTEQIDGITAVGREVMPLMLRMIDTLETFISLDVPFLPKERRNRVAELRSMMDRADVTISEKYRRILEAYQIENEFGRSIEAYRGKLDAAGSVRTVEFLRIGRNALLYQTLDGRQSGYWNAATKSWDALGGEYRLPVRQGLRMAQKQIAPDLIQIPMPAAKAVQ